MTPQGAPHKTLTTTPKDGYLVKPREVIELTGLNHWTLTTRRVWNTLLANAWGERLDNPQSDFMINLAELRGSHDSNDRVRDVLEVMQKTLAVGRVGGRVVKVQMLGGTSMDETDYEREIGMLTYDFPKELVRLLRRSDMYGQLNVKMMGAFTSKYSLALYELIAARIELRKSSEEVSLLTLRDWLGVPSGKLEKWSHFEPRALAIALREVNALSPFDVEIQPIKRGRKVDRVVMSWAKKTPLSTHEQAAVTEVNRHREGRKQRITGTVPIIVDAMHSSALSLPPSAFEQGKKVAPGWDIYALEQQWRDFMADKPHPDNVAGSFVGFCKKKGPRPSGSV